MKVIGYIRVSTDEQAASGLGMADQRQRIVDGCNARGWRLVRVISDEGESAGTLERPGLRRALEALAAGRADGIIVSKLDRLSRSVVDFGQLLEWFRDARKTLVALDLGVDTSTASGELLAGVMIVVAQWERRTIGDRTRAALAARRAQGKPISRPAIADQPELLHRIRRLHDDGKALWEICEILESDGIPTPRGGRCWRPSSLQAAVGYERPPRRRKPADLPPPTRRRRRRAQPAPA